MGGIHLVLAVDPTGRDHADGDAVGLHGADLHGRGLGAQQNGAVFGEIEGVGPLTGGVALVDVQLGEVILRQLHLRAVHNFKAHAHKNVLDLVQHVVHGVLVAQVHRFPGQSHVQSLVFQLLLSSEIFLVDAGKFLSLFVVEQQLLLHALHLVFNHLFGVDLLGFASTTLHWLRTYA